jgi:hypothetical protein
MSKNRIEREIEMVRRALETREPEIKPGYYRLDEDTMTKQEKRLVKGALDSYLNVVERSKKAQNVKLVGELDWSKITLTDDEITLHKAFNIIFQKHAVSPKEYSARHPIH